jgi:thiol-disulfide isomerase/thioredoxin
VLDFLHDPGVLECGARGILLLMEDGSEMNQPYQATLRTKIMRLPVLKMIGLGLIAGLIPSPTLGQTTVAGDIARDFSVIGFTDGEVIRMTDFEGQILILDFFSYWCPHCQSSAPDLETNVRQYFEDRGGNIDGLPVTVLSINLESDNLHETAAFIKGYGVALAANDFAGIGSNAWQQFGARYIPHFVIINGVSGSHTHQQWEVLMSKSGYQGAEAMRLLVDSIRRDAPPKPEITEQPLGTAIEAGKGFVLSISVQSDDPVSYQWLLDGLPIEGATEASYEVPCGQAFHAGGYSVIVSGGDGISVESEVAAVQVNPSTASDARLMNLSTRGLCLGGDQRLIPGFVITGDDAKKLLIRAAGPTLGVPPFSLPGALADPRMTLKQWSDSTGAFEDSAENDNWISNPNADEILTTTARLGGFALTSDFDSALLVELDQGQYTVTAEGLQGGTGLSIVELYDADITPGNAQLLNISNRGFAGEGNGVMIPGFVVSDDGPRTFLIRVVGPTLSAAPYKVSGVLGDPQLSVYRREVGGIDQFLFGNDNWMDNRDSVQTELLSQQLGAFALDPDAKDAALVVTLPPGAYTVVGSSAIPGETGVVLVEVYLVP